MKINTVEASLKRDIKELEVKLTHDIKELELRLEGNIETVKADIIKWVAAMLVAQAGLIAGLIVGLHKLL